MKFTNYLLPLEANAPKSDYLTCYSSIHSVPEFESAVFMFVSQVNQFIRLRMTHFISGKFDDVDLDWKLPKISVLHVADISRANVQCYQWGQSAEAYIPMMKSQMPTYNATLLNRSFSHWPTRFIKMNHSVLSEEYHVSYLPLIRYTNNNLNVITLLTKFKSATRGLSRFEVKTTGKWNLFAKWDMKKVFLGLELEPSTTLTNMFQVMQNFRVSLPDSGVAVGENDGVMIQWIDSTPHITVGVWTSDSKGDSIDLNGSLFGLWELLYLNNVILQSSSILKLHYPAQNFPPDDMDRPLGPQLTIPITSLTLVANGQRLRQQLT